VFHCGVTADASRHPFPSEAKPEHHGLSSQERQQSSEEIAVGYRFHQSFSIIPGLRLNVSKSGLSASIGGAPFTLNISKNGLMGTASIPGTGLSYRHHIGNSNPAPSDGPNHFPSEDVPALNAAPIEKVHSANAELLTSATLQALKDLIQTASKQYNEISHALGLATEEQMRAASRYDSWNQGYLLQRVFKKAFEKRRQASLDASENVQKIDEQLRQSKIATHIEIDKEQADLFDQVVNEFTALCGSEAIWDVRAHQANDRKISLAVRILSRSYSLTSLRLNILESSRWSRPC